MTMTEKSLAEKMQERAQAIGVHQYGWVDSGAVEFSDEVRKLCQNNACGVYGKSWACPPGVGTVEECRSKCMAYPRVLVFSTCTPLEDAFDIDGWREGRVVHERVTREVKQLCRDIAPDCFVLSAEGCSLCAKCTCPDAPCRFPDRVHPAVEGYGIRVDLMAKLAGIRYINGTNTVTYFSAIFF